MDTMQLLRPTITALPQSLELWAMLANAIVLYDLLIADDDLSPTLLSHSILLSNPHRHRRDWYHQVVLDSRFVLPTAHS